MSHEKTRFWTLRWGLAAVALGLGTLAVLGDPYGGESVRVDSQELARMVETEVDHVTVNELANWLLRGRADYRLLDLRSAPEYAEYHIPSAEQASITDLGEYPLSRNETIVLYSAGGIHSAQAWFLLQARGYHGATMLLGGLDAWMDEVLFPSLPGAPTADEQPAVDRARAMSAHFGGQPRVGGEAVASLPAELPKVEAPPAVEVQTRRKKSKDGC